MGYIDFGYHVVGCLLRAVKAVVVKRVNPTIKYMSDRKLDVRLREEVYQSAQWKHGGFSKFEDKLL